MKRYRLNVSLRAEKSADAIFEWLAERSPEGAVNWYVSYRQAVESLHKNPERWPRARELHASEHDVRQILFKTQQGRFYRALFVVLDDTVHVVAVRGRGQDSIAPDDLELPH